MVRVVGIISVLLVVQCAYSAEPTVGEADKFIEKAETELLGLIIESQRAGWVQETYITGDTEALVAKANERLIARATELVEESQRYAKLQLPPELRRKFFLLKLGLGTPAPRDPKLRGELTQI